MGLRPRPSGATGRHLRRWIVPWLRQALIPARPGPLHLFLCIADHFEPSWGGADPSTADRRVQAWTGQYPSLFSGFRDSDGRSPRHSFFYPFDQYRASEVDALAALCAAGHGEVELHLHHDNDTAASLRQTLNRAARLFSERHGVLGRWPDGRPAFGFVHGNWAIANARPDGRWCGVVDELSVLREAGCYADFTMPSAPDITQCPVINSIYYASSAHQRTCPHQRGPRPSAAGEGLMMIQGPLWLARPRGRLLPRIENGCLQRSQPPSAARLDRWIRARVSVAQRPDWVFVKLHTHGATEPNQSVLLGEPMVRFHAELARRARESASFRFHYVTAREMYNLARAAESGWTGDPAGALGLEISPPGPDNRAHEIRQTHPVASPTADSDR